MACALDGQRVFCGCVGILRGNGDGECWLADDAGELEYQIDEDDSASADQPKVFWRGDLQETISGQHVELSGVFCTGFEAPPPSFAVEFEHLAEADEIAPEIGGRRDIAE